ncbi:uncharacterized protein LOC105427810 [Pogonomyrmex barbatus]|uniref:Uncharacterized protein LOC105427810 n=1 Tax=Pogonomyrmex barbatus TaxID=144034 RepID=A0A6I9WBG9_9HYME|nr:uncharacterized protein LOC105427810 [Pogonomyrmex barbatus]
MDCTIYSAVFKSKSLQKCDEPRAAPHRDEPTNYAQLQLPPAGRDLSDKTVRMHTNEIYWIQQIKRMRKRGKVGSFVTKRLVGADPSSVRGHVSVKKRCCRRSRESTYLVSVTGAPSNRICDSPARISGSRKEHVHRDCDV